MTDREILIAAINRQMQEAPERALFGAYSYFLGCGCTGREKETKTAQRAKKRAQREKGD
jgi:hypothetical protein